MKQPIDVEILGHRLTVVSDEQAADVREAAGLVNDQMRRLAASQPAASTLQIAMLAALNIASDYWKLRRQERDLREAVERLSLRMLERLTG